MASRGYRGVADALLGVHFSFCGVRSAAVASVARVGVAEGGGPATGRSVACATENEQSHPRALLVISQEKTSHDVNKDNVGSWLLGGIFWWLWCCCVGQGIRVPR